jgi:hypothetical protein
MARWVKEIVDQLDLTAVYGSYTGRGSDGCDPRCLLRMVLYEVLQGRMSPAAWHKSLNIDGSSTLRWLGMGIRPSRSTWYNFRDRMGPFLQDLNAAEIQRAQQAGLTTGEVGVQDGTLLRACVTRHHLLHAQQVERRLTQLRDTIAQDHQGLTVIAPQWMAQTPATRERQLEAYLLAQQVLQRRLAQNAQRQKSKRLAEKHVVVGPSDPDAVPGRDKEKVFCALYNVQYVVDHQSLLILAYDVFSQATDAGTLAPLLDRMKQVLGHYPRQHVTDAGYVSILDLQVCQERQVQLNAPYQENDYTAAKKAQRPPKQFGKDQFQWLADQNAYRCPQGHLLHQFSRQTVTRRESEELQETRYRCDTELCAACPLKAQCCPQSKQGRQIKRLEGEELLVEHQQRMQAPEAKQLRRQRGSVIERAFADMKQHRNVRRLHSRGKSRVEAEIGLLVLAQNLITLRRLKQRATMPTNNTT